MAEWDSLVEENRMWWDERVPIHMASDFYELEAFMDGQSSLAAFEIEEIGGVAGRSLLHLQCHFGLDSLSWARLGARVHGLDFSSVAIEAAEELTRSLGLDASFAVGNVYDAWELLNEQFDIVYTGKGTVAWLPDLDAWAKVIAALLRPGGVFYVVDFHPFMGVFSYQKVEVATDYFFGLPIVRADKAGSYADLGAQTTNNTTVQWQHPFGTLLTALAAGGLRIEFVHEFPFTFFERWPFAERGQDGLYRLPPGMPELPLAFSIRARKD